MREILNTHRTDFDLQIDHFCMFPLAEAARLPLITIYRDPVDYPGKYVARLFDSAIPRATRYIVISDTLDDLHMRIPITMIKIPRNLYDDEKIVEIWV